MKARTGANFEIEPFMRTVTERPGVYRMIDAKGEILYVGKAANLRSRLSSYFQKKLDHPKTRAMVSHVADVQTTVTESAAAALILEHNLIKEHRPRYNVVLRDDKSYPYVFVSTKDAYPRLSYQRGARRAKGKYIGPYPSAGAVKKSMRLVQKLFRVRQCEDSYFANRSRPCLQHQIKRCTAPCVGLISEADYAEDVALTVAVLEGRSQAVIKDLAVRMDEASGALEFERAARLRDQIGSLKAVGDLAGSLDGGSSTDYVAAVTGGGQSAVQVFFVRNGVNLGNKGFHPSTPVGASSAEILEAFVAQFYLEHEVPREIVLAEAIGDVDLYEEVLRARAKAPVSIVHRVRGERGEAVAAGDDQRRDRARHAAGEPCGHGRPARGGARAAGARRCAGAHGVLRHQPHDGRGDGRLVRRVRPRGPASRRLPALQHRGRHRRRRLRRDAPGADAALHAAAQGGSASCRRSCSSTAGAARSAWRWRS